MFAAIREKTWKEKGQKMLTVRRRRSRAELCESEEINRRPKPKRAELGGEQYEAGGVSDALATTGAGGCKTRPAASGGVS